jgi:hypothetical protein
MQAMNVVTFRQFDEGHKKYPGIAGWALCRKTEGVFQYSIAT